MKTIENHGCGIAINALTNSNLTIAENGTLESSQGSSCPAKWTLSPLPNALSSSRFNPLSLVYDDSLHILWAVVGFQIAAFGNQSLYSIQIDSQGGLLAPPMAINASYGRSAGSCNLSASAACHGCARCMDEASYDCGSTPSIRCTKCRSCLSNQFQAIPCSNLEDTQCQNCSNCSSDSIVASACSKYSDTQCKTNQILAFYQSIVGGSGTLSLKVMIAYLSAQGLYAYIPAVENLAAANGEISVSEFSIFAQYWWFGKNVTKQCTCPAGRYALYNCSDAHHNTTCNVCSECTSGQYEAAPCATASDTVCNTCSECEPDFFESQPCSNDSDVTCTACTVCGLGKYVVTPCYNDTDSVCDISRPSEVVFSVVMPQSKAQFEEDQDAYIVSMGETLFKEEAMASSPHYNSWTEEEKFIYYNKSVHVTSVQEVTLRRRLLAVGCDVGTAVSVGGDSAAADVTHLVSAGDFMSELNSNLESNGLPAADGVSKPTVVAILPVTTPPPSASSKSFPTATVVGSAVGGVAFLGLVGISSVLLLRSRAGVSVNKNANMNSKANAEMVLLDLKGNLTDSDDANRIDGQMEITGEKANDWANQAHLNDPRELLSHQQSSSELRNDRMEPSDTHPGDMWSALMCTHVSEHEPEHAQKQQENSWLQTPLEGLQSVAAWLTSTISSVLPSKEEHHKNQEEIAAAL